MSKDVEVHKRSATIVYMFVEALKRLELAHPMVGYYGRHREDNIIRVWQYGKKYGK